MVTATPSDGGDGLVDRVDPRTGSTCRASVLSGQHDLLELGGGAVVDDIGREDAGQPENDGASLSAVGADLLVAVAVRPRRVVVIATAPASAIVGPLAWNAILRATHGNSFFVDAPVAASRCHGRTGSGVFTLAATPVLRGLGPLARDPGRTLLAVAVLARLLN